MLDGKASTDCIRQELGKCLTQNRNKCLSCSFTVIVSLRQIVNDETKKMKRLLLPHSVTQFYKTDVTLQVTNYKEMSNDGSLLPTLHQTTTSFGNHTVAELQNGSSRARS